MIRKLQFCYAAISTSPRKSATSTTRGYGKTGSSSVSLSEKLCDILRNGALPIHFVCTPKSQGIIRGGIIAPARFAATSACASITSGPQRRWLPGAAPLGSIKNRGAGSARPIMRRSWRSLSESQDGVAQRARSETAGYQILSGTIRSHSHLALRVCREKDISLCASVVLCVSVVKLLRKILTTEHTENH